MNIDLGWSNIFADGDNNPGLNSDLRHLSSCSYAHLLMVGSHDYNMWCADYKYGLSGIAFPRPLAKSIEVCVIVSKMWNLLN
jgi:hypothetical protein